MTEKNAQERLAAAMKFDRWPDEVAAAVLSRDPHLAQDIEDGAALRRLREALPVDHYLTVSWCPGPNGYRWEAWALDTVAPPPVASMQTGSSIAQAAYACREALK